jgi:hypothetical protein
MVFSGVSLKGKKGRPYNKVCLKAEKERILLSVYILWIGQKSSTRLYMNIQ